MYADKLICCLSLSEISIVQNGLTILLADLGLQSELQNGSLKTYTNDGLSTPINNCFKSKRAKEEGLLFPRLEKTCLYVYNLNEEEIYAIDRFDVVPEDNKNYNSFINCVYRVLGILNNLKIDIDRAKSVFTEALEIRHKYDQKLKEHPSFIKETIDTAMENCKGKEGGAALRNCLLLNKDVKVLHDIVK